MTYSPTRRMPPGRSRTRQRLGFAVAVAVCVIAAAPGVVASGSEEEHRLGALETGIAQLSGSVEALSAGLSSLPIPQAVRPEADEPVILVAQSQDVAGLTVRLSQLEEQMRVLTGQIEGLQFQLTQMQTLLERLQEDNEFRFQQLEGGGLGNNGAAVQSGGDMPSGGLPQDPNAAQDFNANQDLNAPQDLDAPQDLSMPSEGLSDPTGVVVQGEPEVPLGTLPADELAVGTEPGVGQPLDLTFDAGGLVTDADADAQYRAGYDAVVSGDYAFAEDQFRQFIGLFPDHPQAPDATAWLGETLIRRGAFDEAADVLLIGFESYPNSGRAPDLLLKLGIALNGAGERETACRTFGEVSRRFLNLTDAFQSRLRQEMAAASC